MEALEHLLNTDIALVLLDVSMPGMDGFETAQMIHEHPRFQTTPIVFISAIHVTDLDRLNRISTRRCGLRFRSCGSGVASCKSEGLCEVASYNVTVGNAYCPHDDVAG